MGSFFSSSDEKSKKQDNPERGEFFMWDEVKIMRKIISKIVKIALLVLLGLINFSIKLKVGIPGKDIFCGYGRFRAMLL